MSFFDGFRSFFNAVPLAGSLTQAIWGSPEEEAFQRAIKGNKEAYERRLPQMRAERLQQARQRAGAYAPLNDLMGRMYGPSAQIDYGALLADPRGAGGAPPPATGDLRQPIRAGTDAQITSGPGYDLNLNRSQRTPFDPSLQRRR